MTASVEDIGVDVWSSVLRALYGDDKRSVGYRRVRKKTGAYATHIEATLVALGFGDDADEDDETPGVVYETTPAMVISGDVEQDEHDLPPEAYTVPASVLPVEVGPLAADQSLDERTFYIPRAALAEAREMAENLGIKLTAEDADREDIFRWLCAAFAEDRNLDQKAVRSTANQLAGLFTQITINYPAPTYSILATAELLSYEKSPNGKPMVDLREAEPFWTEARIRNLDFTRCDQCGKRMQRKYVYMVLKNNSAESFVQLGGACAAQLDLGKKLAAMLHAVRNLVNLMWKLLTDYGLADEIRGGGYKLRAPLDVDRVIEITDFVISRRGYISRAKADETNQGATSYFVDAILHPAYSRNGEVANRAYSAIVRAYMTPEGKQRVAILKQRMYQAAEDPKLSQDPKFATAFQNAVYGGFGLGMLVFAVSKAIKMDGVYRAVMDKARPWSLTVENEDPMPTSYVELEPIARRGHWENAHEMLISLLGEADAEKERKLWLKNPNGIISGRLIKAMKKHPHGLWAVLSKYSGMGDYGTFHKATVIRLDDYRMIELSGNAAANLDKGNVIRIISGSQAGTTQPRVIRGRTEEENIHIPSTMRVNRAEVEVVRDVRGFGAEHPPPAIPEISSDMLKTL